VDGAESDPGGAMRVNAAGADVLAAVSERLGASVVYPSTDYVFDGAKRDPYVESDPTGPASAYGESKLGGEQATAHRNPRHFVVRSSWLFGLHGRNFVDTMLRLGRERGELRVVGDQVGCPTFTGHLARALVELVEGEAYGVHHVAGAGQCSWFELAVEALRGADVDCRVEAVTTEEFPRPAPRPAYSVLATERADGPSPLPHWSDGVAAYLAEREAIAAAPRT
jgi:dTDP-4-dehydrorhamnose reductase